MAFWRMTLDPPHQYPISPAYRKTQHCADFNPPPGGMDNTWRCPVTGVVMLKPSFNTHDLANFAPLSQFRTAPDFWQTVDRGTNNGMMASLKPADKPLSFIEINVQVAIIAILANAAAQDDLLWTHESTFTLVPDESFSVHYFGSADEITRKNNWFSVQWDDCYMHFSHEGVVRVYQYKDRTNLVSGGYDLIEQFQIGSPGDFLNRQGYFIFMPIPTFGLAIYHYTAAQQALLLTSSVHVATSSGHLVKWPSRDMPDGTKRLFESSPVRFAFNPYQKHIPGLERTVFPLSGTYTDATFDPGLQTAAADEVTPGVVPSAQQNITTSVRKPDDSADWAAGTDRAFCTRHTLQTSDNRLTPFLYGYAVVWNAHFATRATTPLMLQQKTPEADATGTRQDADRLLKLQFSEDEHAHFEGTATVLLSGAAARKIAQRGDCTYLIEYSEDQGVTWQFLAAGLATHFDLTPHFMAGWGFFYSGTLALKDYWERFKEAHVVSAGAFDNLSVGEGINQFLSCAQMPKLASIPAIALTRKLPSVENQAFKWKMTHGEDGEKVLQAFLLFLHTQGVEWRMRFDWPNNHWVLEKKPHDIKPGSVWKLSPFSADLNKEGKVWVYDSAPSPPKYNPERPEGNVFQVAGAFGKGSETVIQVSARLVNAPSYSDPTSLDYLGRMILVEWDLPILPDKDECNRMARRLKDEAGHHRDKATLPISKLNMALVPNTHIQALDGTGGVWLDGWIKHRHVTIEMNDKETMSIEVDSVWEAKSRK